MKNNKGQFKEKPIAWVVNEHGCWICTSHCKNKKGYPYKKNNKRQIYISRIMYEKYKGPIPTGMCVLHNCPGGDNTGCINPDHLWAGTKGDNNRDRSKKGRNNHIVGERHCWSKLTEKQVLEIRNANGTLKEIAKRYGISYYNVGYIKRRITWKYL